MKRKMKKYKILFISICIIAIYACGSGKNKIKDFDQVVALDVARVDAPEVPPPPPQIEEQLKYTPPKIVKDEEIKNNKNIEIDHQKMIIKNGNLSIKSKQIDSSKKYLDVQLKKHHAYYESENLFNESDKISYTLRIRVPAINFEQFVAGIENGKNEIISKSIQADDVTEEFVDIETRLKNKRNFLKKYNELLTKANTIKDILAIEENIRILQEEIESKEGRLKYLSHQVGYSTLEINLFQQKDFIFKPDEQDSFFERVKNSISKGWFFIIDLLIFVIILWPIAILAGIIFFIVKKLSKK